MGSVIRRPSLAVRDLRPPQVQRFPPSHERTHTLLGAAKRHSLLAVLKAEEWLVPRRAVLLAHLRKGGTIRAGGKESGISSVRRPIRADGGPHARSRRNPLEEKRRHTPTVPYGRRAPHGTFTSRDMSLADILSSSTRSPLSSAKHPR